MLLAVLLLSLCLAAVYVSIGRVLINTIDHFRPNIETLVSDALNIPVSIRMLDGSWTYLDPKIIVEGLVIGSVENPAIRLRHVVLELDTVATVLKGTIIIRAIELEGLKLSVQRAAEGGWFVVGIPRSEELFNPEPLLDSVAFIESVRLREVDIGVLGQRIRYKVSSDAEHPFELSSINNVKTLSWPLILSYSLDKTTNSTQFQLSGRYQGDPREEDFKCELYLDLPPLELTEFMPTYEFRGYELAQMELSGEFWMNVEKGGFEVKGLPRVGRVVLESSQDRVELLNGSNIEFIADFASVTQGSVYFQSLESTIVEEAWQLNGASFSFQKNDKGMELSAHVASVPISKISNTLIKLGRRLDLFDSATINTIQALNTRGSVEEILLLAQVGEESPALRASGALQNVRVDTYKGVPVFSDLDGFISLSAEDGFLDIHNDQPFEMLFPKQFREPWDVDSAHARINYSYQSGILRLNSSLIELTSGAMTVKGRLVMNLPKNERDQNWGLEVGILNADLLEAHLYMPNTISVEVRKWVNQAILRGVSNKSGIVIHGSFAAVSPKKEKSHELFFSVQDVILDYTPEWPRIDDLVGTIYIGNREVHSDDVNGMIFDSEVFSSEVTIPVLRSGMVDSILVNGNLRGSFSDGIRFLTETPLYLSTNKIAEGWIGSGAMAATVLLDIPIGERAGEDPQVDVTVTVDQSRVFMPSYDLQVDELFGDFSYETERGLNSEGFTATLFDKAAVGRIETHGNSKGGVINVHVDGDVEIESLYRWSDQILLTRADGAMDYQSTLYVPYGDQVREPIFLEATTNLRGVEIDLPSPMFKARGSEVAFKYRQIFLDSGYRIELNLEDEVKASLKIWEERLVGGQIHFGKSTMGAVAYNDLNVTGEINHVTYEEWQALSEDLDDKSSVSLEDELVATLDSINIDVGTLDVFGFELDDIEMSVTRGTGAWQVQLENKMLMGNVSISDDDALALGINLDYLRFDRSEDVASDPLSDVHPEELTSVDFSVAQLLLDDENYGTWSFNYRPQSSGSVLESVSAEVKGIKLNGSGSVYWQLQDDIHKSLFEGDVVVPDLAVALEEWGFASSIEGEEFDFQVEVSWPGSPAMIDLETISGTVQLTDGKGRFVQADANVGPLKLLGIFDFASIGRRFRFDFDDVVESGFSFDKISGSSRFNQGIVDVVDPIIIEGAASIFKVGGRINLVDRQLDNDMIVTLPVNRNLPWYAAYSAIAVGPLTGAGVFIAQRLFKKQINAISSAKYKITGSVDEPVIEFVSIFDDTVRETPEDSLDLPTGE